MMVVTGATGFIGGAVAQTARAAGLRVRTTARRSVDRADHVQLDLLRDDCSQLVERDDVLVHCAGVAHQFMGANTTAMWDVNVHATRRIVQAALNRNAARVVLISSVSVYGGGGARPSETASTTPADDYGRSKLAGEAAVRTLCGRAGVPLDIVRLGTAYGEGDPGNVARLIRLVLSGRFIWIGRGDNRKCLVHNSDAARAIVAVARRTGPGCLVNVAGDAHPMRDIVQQISMAANRVPPRYGMPGWPVVAIARTVCRFGRPRALAAAGRTVVKFAGNDTYDDTRMRRLGWKPEVDLRCGISSEVKWLLNSHAMPAKLS